MPDFEDAVMIAAAVREKMDCIVTGNLNNCSPPPVRVLTPQRMIREIGGCNGNVSS